MNSLQKPLLLVIAGPTASGKTALSIEIAKYFGAEIISCDARQFYRETTIGTAKPTKEELNEVPHHFINSHSIDEPYSAGDYEKDVLGFLDNYFKNNNIAVMVGGSGLFMRIVCEGVDSYPEIAVEIREELQKIYSEKGIEVLQDELKNSDPVYYHKVDLNNPHRLIRALEVCRASGQAFSSFQGKNTVNRPFRIIKIALDWNRAALYERINKRVEIMLEQGLEAEARKLYPQKELNALQTVGYKEFFDYFDAKISKAAAVEKIKQNSRNYAKRQLTWLRKEKDIIWVQMPDNPQNIINLLKAKI
jgi:tRNA dimethylallyltransferase